MQVIILLLKHEEDSSNHTSYSLYRQTVHTVYICNSFHPWTQLHIVYTACCIIHLFYLFILFFKVNLLQNTQVFFFWWGWNCCSFMSVQNYPLSCGNRIRLHWWNDVPLHNEVFQNKLRLKMLDHISISWTVWTAGLWKEILHDALFMYFISCSLVSLLNNVSCPINFFVDVAIENTVFPFSLGSRPPTSTNFNWSL